MWARRKSDGTVGRMSMGMLLVDRQLCSMVRLSDKTEIACPNDSFRAEWEIRDYEVGDRVFVPERGYGIVSGVNSKGRVYGQMETGGAFSCGVFDVQ